MLIDSIRTIAISTGVRPIEILQKRIGILFLYLLFLLPVYAQQRLISGVVRDAETKEAMAYCNIILVFGGRSQGTMTDALGRFSLVMPVGASVTGGTAIRMGASIPVPSLQPCLIVSYSGYCSDTIPVIAGRDQYIIALRPGGRSLQEAVVTTGVSKAVSIRENPVAILSISSRKMDRTIESNVIDVLVKNAPGLNAVKTGPNISKPFIRGLGYNRVLTLYDGIRQEGQQWGDEHGIEVDGYNIQRAEVIKGPASLMYGSDAVAGVISLFPYIPSEKDGLVHGRLLSEYQTNNGLIGNGLRLGYSNAHWVWALRGSYKLAKSYQNPVDGRVYLTGFQEKNGSGLLGYTSERGYSYLNATLYDNLQGIPDGSRDSLTRQFTRQIDETGKDDIRNRPVVPESELNSYRLSPLHQHIQHYRIYVNNHYRVGGGMIDGTAGFQQNVRREYDHSTDPEQAGLFVRLNTYNYGLRYDLPAMAGLDLSIGVNGMYQQNKNKNATDFPIPNYQLLDLGSFVYALWKRGNWTISGGLRSDTRRIRGGNFYIRPDSAGGFNHEVRGSDTVGAVLQFPALRQNFSGISLSLGATRKVSDQFSIKFNIARGYRSPNITEIASNGLDPGAHIVYLGNRGFVPEFSMQEDLGLLANYREFDWSVSIFNNEISHYIYLTQLQDASGNPITLVPGNKTFKYEQAAARLYGAEAMVNIHPAVWRGVHWLNQLLLTYGNNTLAEYKNKGVNGQYLPLIPPPRVVSSLDWDLPYSSKFLQGLNLKTEYEYTAPQNRYLALDNTELPARGYTLVNLGCSVTINYAKERFAKEGFVKERALQVLLQVNNVLDVAYQSNLSRLRYFEYYTQSPNGHLGIYNMGRNICMKVICPF